jgi:hypothetical protein
MKLTDALIILSLLLVFAGGFSWSCKFFYDLDSKYYKLQKKVDSANFVRESFIKTCNGDGYKDLDEWQKNCRKIWQLDYIAWCNAEDFMDVSYENSPSALFYGCWENENGFYEVYCRKKGVVND